MRACPHCASRIPDVAIVCRYCGRNVTPLTDHRPEPQGSPAATLIRAAALALLLLLAGIALLYVYRAQSPSGTPVPYAQAVAEIQGGRVHLVTFNSDTATIELFGGSRQTVAVSPNARTDLMRVITDHNATVPQDQRITVAASGPCC
jgi:hypothetical protein